MIARETADCTTLDVRGGAMFLYPTNGNVTFSPNATLGLLSSVLREGAAPRLEALLLSGSSQLADGGIRALAPAMRQHGRLTTLTLDGCNITASGVGGVVAGVLFESSPLRSLSLARNHLGESGAGALADALANNAALTSLTLSASGLGGAGGAAIAASLSAGGGRALERLTLDRNGLGDEGAAAFGEALASAPPGGSITSLDLSGNRIGARGGEALAAALGLPSTSGTPGDRAPWRVRLSHLWLSSNDARGAGAASMAASGRVRTVSLHDNAIPRQVADALDRSLRHGRHLERIDGLRHNDAWPGGVAARIEASLARNADAQARSGGAPHAKRHPYVV
jgi:hypothetical protein